ncbi:MAG TPA: hypothetical protein VGF74_20255, partial [Thermoleophilaceae bacterium]
MTTDLRQGSSVDAAYPWERPLGAFPGEGGRAEFRVWAPRVESLGVRVNGRDSMLEQVGFAVHEGELDAQPGDDYVFVADGKELPDPCSRSQPHGLRGPSRLVDAGALAGHAADFETPRLEELVLYELHVGTFTP